MTKLSLLRKPVAWVIGVVLSTFLFALTLTHRANPGLSYFSTLLRHGQPLDLAGIETSERSYFHLLVPATNSNKNLCRLLLSSAALNYPSPVFINWGKSKPEDSEYAIHLAKVQGILQYLEGLSKDHDDDLVLIIDGFDTWFQLRPDVLIKRYFDAMRKGNEALDNRFGAERRKKLGIYNSVVFGADKICWPEDPTRPACWAVPDSPLPRYAFGPDTDSGFHRHLYRPKWLNSGTVMGPVADVRRVFQYTIKQITEHHTLDSDQMYFAGVWGRQEYVRTLIADGPLNETSRKMWIPQGYGEQGYVGEIRLKVPTLNPGLAKDRINELHITVDYESALFQTMAHYWPYVGWVSYKETSDSNSNQFSLPEDILASRPPSAEAVPDFDGATWNDFTLLTNAITNQIPAIMHFTPPKYLRQVWWSKTWYYPYGEAILNSSSTSSTPTPITMANGRVWWRYENDLKDDISEPARIGGGFSDTGAWLSWRRMCQSHENAVFKNELEEGEGPLPSLHDLFPLEHKLRSPNDKWKVEA